jgi:hypothetical protein
MMPEREGVASHRIGVEMRRTARGLEVQGVGETGAPRSWKCACDGFVGRMWLVWLMDASIHIGESQEAER